MLKVLDVLKNLLESLELQEHMVSFRRAQGWYSETISASLTFLLPSTVPPIRGHISPIEGTRKALVDFPCLASRLAAA